MGSLVSFLYVMLYDLLNMKSLHDYDNMSLVMIMLYVCVILNLYMLYVMCIKDVHMTCHISKYMINDPFSCMPLSVICVYPYLVNVAY